MKLVLHSFWKLHFLVMLLLALTNAGSAHAQVNAYIFSTTTDNILEVGSFTTLLGAGMDDEVSAETNIGFTFKYGGTDYTTFSATSNGLLKLGGLAPVSYNNVTAPLTGPFLLPYWDDNVTDNDGNVQYLLQGVPGSRKLVIEYNLSSWSYQGTADKHFQIWLFEATNEIRFVYGDGNNMNADFTTAILTNGTTDFISVNTSLHASSNLDQVDNNTEWPGAGRAYSFMKGATLPVTFLNFSGYKDGNRNQLQWATATELNNLGFEVQRSADGINYSPVGFVNSQASGGNSTSALNYRFTDNNVTGSRQYYRLRQVDIDNRSKLSSIVLVDGDKPVLLKVEGTFPNPATTTINLQIASPGKGKVTASLSDMTGKMVMQKIINVEAGRNIVPIDVSQLANNSYLLKVTDATGASYESLKVMIIK
ncbi:MAG TPA: T9SS type A sorting domain-containing protein [Chitinophagaceae bacterium]